MGDDGFGSADRIGKDMDTATARQLVAVGHSAAYKPGGWPKPIDLGALRFTADIIFWDYEEEEYRIGAQAKPQAKGKSKSKSKSKSAAVVESSSESEESGSSSEV
eukprot:COSAG06_NODE_27957_length_583_cov_0.975207_2_plen_105_part_01